MDMLASNNSTVEQQQSASSTMQQQQSTDATNNQVDKEQVFQWILDLGDQKKREQALLELRFLFIIILI